MNSTSYLSNSIISLEETDPSFIGIKEEYEEKPIIEQVFICNSNFSDSYGNNPVESSCTSQVEQNASKITTDRQSLLNCVKQEDEITGERTMHTSTNQGNKLLEDFEEKPQIVVKSEVALCEVNSLNCYDEAQMQTLTNMQKSNTNIQNIQEQCYAEDCKEIKKEENEGLQCVKKEVIEMEHSVLHEEVFVKDEITAGKL